MAVFSAGIRAAFDGLKVVIQEVTTELRFSWCYVCAGSKRRYCKLARRAAAAYGDGCELICGPSHFKNRMILDVSEAELAADMARF